MDFLIFSLESLFLRLSNNIQMIVRKADADHERTIPQILHSQLPTYHSQYSIYNIYEHLSHQFYVHKLMLLPPDFSKIVQKLYPTRASLYNHIATIPQMDLQLPSRFFSQKLSLQVERKTETENLLTIKQPFLRGSTLADIIRDYNQAGGNLVQQVHVFIENLIGQLINLFLRIERQALFIPTFRTIIFDLLTNQVHLNLFSFAGIKLIKQNMLVSQEQLKEVLPFLDHRTLQSQENGVDLVRALAVIILGLLLGKEINLLTSKDKKVFNLEQLKQLVSRTPQKYKKILTSKHVKTLITAFEKQTKVKIGQFLIKVLINEEQISWSKCIRCIFNPSIIHQTSEAEVKNQQKANKLILQLADSRWKNLTFGQKMYYIHNKIVSVTSAYRPLKKLQDCELFLIVSLKLDFSMLSKKNYSLSELISKIQNKHISHFNSTIDQTVKAFFKAEQDEMGSEISSFMPQSGKKWKKKARQLGFNGYETRVDKCCRQTNHGVESEDWQSTRQLLIVVTQSKPLSENDQNTTEETRIPQIEKQHQNKYHLQVGQTHCSPNLKQEQDIPKHIQKQHPDLYNTAKPPEQEHFSQQNCSRQGKELNLAQGSFNQRPDQYEEQSKLKPPQLQDINYQNCSDQEAQGSFKQQLSKHSQSTFDHIQTLLHEPQIHKFGKQNSLYKLQSSWLKTLRMYEKCIFK